MAKTIHTRFKSLVYQSKRHIKAAFASLIAFIIVFLSVSVAQAQTEILGNPGFEDFPAPLFGNNLNTVSVAPWVLGTGNNPNVVRVDGPGGQDYIRGPEIDAANPGANTVQHYLDIIDGANDFYQSFTVPACPSNATQVYRVIGSFSSRADRNGNPVPASGSITIRNGVGATGSVVSGPNLSVTNLLNRLTWTTLSGDYNLIAGQTYSYVVEMGNNTNFDEASLIQTSTCLTAINDDFSSSPIPKTGGVTSSVFGNDDVNGVTPTSSSVDVSLTNIGSLSGATINTDGTINVPANTLGGDYTLTYEICEPGSTSNCISANVDITVVLEPELTVTKTASSIPPSIQPGDDITYTFIIENSGNIVIEDVEPVDTGPTFNAITGATRAGTNNLSDFTIVTEAGFIDTDANTDLAVDSLAPGESAKFTATYELSEIDFAYMRNAADPTTAIDNSATATGNPIAGILPAVVPSLVETGVVIPRIPRPDLIPSQCGAFLSEGYSDIISGYDEARISFDSGQNDDPYTYMNFARLPSGKVEAYYTSLIGAGLLSGNAFTTTTPVPEIIVDDSSNSGGNGPENGVPTNARSEFYRVAVRFDGVGGTTETLTLQTQGSQEHTAYWITDTSGNVVSASDFQLTSVNGGGVGNNLDIPITFPANGIAYLNIAMLDATLRHGFYTFASGYTCPADVSLDANKTVSMFGASGTDTYAIPGNDVIYTITVTNSGADAADADSIKLVDLMPPEISFWNGDIDFGGPDNFTDTTPVVFEQTPGAGLTFNYNTDVRFGFGATAPADFNSCSALTPDGTYRDDVNFICFNPKGAMNGGTTPQSFSVNFRGRIK